MKPIEMSIGFSSGGDSRGRLEPENGSKDPRGAPKGNQNRTTHGVHAVTRLVKRLGPDRALDRRTAIGKALALWRDELIESLGGNETVTPQQLIVIDQCIRTRLILNSIDRWIFQQPSLIDKRKRALLPAVKERQSLANALVEYLAQLGLERKGGLDLARRLMREKQQGKS